MGKVEDVGIKTSEATCWSSTDSQFLSVRNNKNCTMQLHDAQCKCTITHCFVVQLFHFMFGSTLYYTVSTGLNNYKLVKNIKH